MQPAIVILIYFLVIILIGIFSSLKIKTPSDYYVAGKNAGTLQVSGSLLATILGGSAILGTIELSARTGWAALWFLFAASAGLFLLVPLARRVRRFGRFTLPELLGLFYGKKAELTAAIIIPVAWIGIVAAQVIAAAKIISGIGIMDYYTAALVSGFIFIVYTLIGGQISILKTDVFQTFLIFAGLLSLTLVSIGKSGFELVQSFTPGKMFHTAFTPFDLFILFCTYSVTFIVGPDIYSRVFCSRNEKTAMRSVLIAAVLLLPGSFILTYLGIAGSANGNDIFTFAHSMLPSWFYGLFLAALLSAVMSSADTTLLTQSLILSELTGGDPDNLQSLKRTRWFVVGTGIASIFAALFVTSILQSLLLALTFFSGAFVIPVLAGLLKLKVVKRQVFTAIIAGGTLALAGKLLNYFTDPFAGNLLISSAFVANGLVLFVPFRPGKKRIS